MPLLTSIIRSKETSTNNSILYENTTGSRAEMLQDISMTEMIGMFNQLSDLVEVSTKIFTGLQDMAAGTSRRIRSVSNRLEAIALSLPALPKALEDGPGQVVTGSSSMDWRSVDLLPNSLFCEDTRPAFIRDRYEEAKPLGAFDQMDQYSATKCSLKYSDPSFFVEAWKRSEAKKQEALEKEKKARKEQKMARKKAQVPNLKPIVQPAAIKVFRGNYNAKGKEFGDAEPLHRHEHASQSTALNTPIARGDRTVVELPTVEPPRVEAPRIEAPRISFDKPQLIEPKRISVPEVSPSADALGTPMMADSSKSTRSSLGFSPVSATDSSRHSSLSSIPEQSPVSVVLPPPPPALPANNGGVNLPPPPKIPPPPINPSSSATTAGTTSASGSGAVSSRIPLPAELAPSNADSTTVNTRSDILVMIRQGVKLRKGPSDDPVAVKQKAPAAAASSNGVMSILQRRMVIAGNSSDEEDDSDADEWAT
eukprot:GILJ01009577.1.p1 GENE.GILJ01009577.1~~GILJ01009577.1.p1  ORF type:complete len:480 (-),score=110.23 GILJ01009577.1:118-1557(-)